MSWDKPAFERDDFLGDLLNAIFLSPPYRKPREKKPMTQTVLRIQPANTETGEYDVHEPLPYPIYVTKQGSILRQDYWEGKPARLVGFQRRVMEGRIDLWMTEAIDPEDAKGMFAVVADKDGSIGSFNFPVSDAEWVESDLER